MLTVGSLFAGIGGIDLAFVNAGFSIAWQVEIDDFCQQVLTKNFPDVPKYRDIYDCTFLPYVDVITAGFPCQPFSIAGKQQGQADERYLVPEMLRIIDETRPTLVFLENVPHFARLNDGDEFKELLRAFAGIGYTGAQWQHISAKDAGAPHTRERWFCVLTLSDSERERRDTGSIDRSTVLRGDRNGGIVSESDGRDTVRDEPDAVCGIREPSVGDSECVSLQRNGNIRERFPSARSGSSSLTRSGGRGGQTPSPQSGLGGASDGIPYRVDRHQFPSSRGVPQYYWEPERTTDRTDHRRDRIKALGNAVVPQVIYPVAVAMNEFLSGCK